MLDDDDRPSKKIRTTQLDTANAETLARAIGHVQQRQKQWSVASGGRDNRREVEQAPTAAPAGPNTPARNRPGEERPGQERQQQGSERVERGNRSGTAKLKHHETPLTIETPNMSMSIPRVAHGANSRSSMDAVNASGRRLPSLPSPAPSDDNTQSPTFTEGQLGQLGPPRGYLAGATPGRTPAEGISMQMHMSAPPASASASPSPLSAQSPTFPIPSNQQQYIQSGVRQPSHHLLSQAHSQLQPPQGQRQIRQQGQQPSPHQIAQQLPWQVGPRQDSQSRPNSISTSSANMPGVIAQPLRTPPTLPSNQHGHPKTTQLYAPASRRSIKDLLAEISQREKALNESGRLTPTNNGRLLLLKDSVEKGDWFYQILSQLFCLRTIEPDSLPQSINGVGSKCFDMLDALLCSNRDVDPDLLRFFSRFPEPIMNIYSSASGETREQYEVRLRMVKDFLMKLPLQWDGLVHRCQAMQSPPLVQDLVETLGLRSVILQTTAFRAIARMFWGLVETKGSRAIEQLHMIDQEMYHRQGWRRSAVEKNECYQRYHYTFQKWSQAVGEQRTNFTTPREVLQYFKQVPPSTMRNFQQQQQLWQQHEQQQQQRQMQQMQHFPAGMQPLTRTPQNQQQMQMQRQAHGPQQSQPQGIHMPSAQQQVRSNLTPVSMAMPGHHTPPIGLRQRLPFFPRSGSQPRAQPTHPDPNRSALHQAHLRSPLLGPNTPEPETPRMYRHVVGYGMAPTKLRKAAAVQHIPFQISEATFKRLAKNETALYPGAPLRRNLTDQSFNFRLRCCTCPANGFATESSWIISDNYWPDDMSFSLNGHELETRRKLHNGRYLPVDLTEFICEGPNTLQIILNRMDRDLKKSNYAVAVEAVGVVTHDSIKNNIRHLSATESLDAIKRSLSGEDGGDDDDIVLTSSNKTIKLIEPYSGCNMVDIPVRGSACLHHDCFDLEVFLSLCRRPHEGWPTVVDCWRCPICRGDVRPQMLIVDEFLLEVRDTLAKQNQLDARVIVVEADGSWKVKEEERKGVRSASLEREERRKQSLAAVTAPAPKKVIEVIELEDD